MTAPLVEENGHLTYEGYEAVRRAMTVSEWERVKAKSQWEHMTPWQVLNDWPSLRGSGASALAEGVPS